MNLVQQTKELCRIYGIIPARSKGQNFLINEKIYDYIIQAADLGPEDTVLEVGPGFGFLTARLSRLAKKVVAVELDDQLSGALRDGLSLHQVKNVEVVNEDILKINPAELFINKNTDSLSGRTVTDSKSGLMEKKNSKHGLKGDKMDYKIVANLPYNITSIFLRKFLSETGAKPASMTLMLQKEVAERISVRLTELTGGVKNKKNPGGQAGMSVLAVSVQFYAEPKIIRTVSKGNFYPSPAVDSAIINLSVYHPLPENRRGVDEKKFFRLVKHGFSSRRRMLKNNLAGGLKIGPESAEKALLEAGLDLKIRAESLMVEDWLKLFDRLKGYMV